MPDVCTDIIINGTKVGETCTPGKCRWFEFDWNKVK